jgi:hypothetical protein
MNRPGATGTRQETRPVLGGDETLNLIRVEIIIGRAIGSVAFRAISGGINDLEL